MAEPVFASVEPEDYPFVVELFRDDTQTVLWRQEVPGPGALHIPGFSGQYRVRCRIFYPNGDIYESD